MTGSELDRRLLASATIRTIARVLAPRTVFLTGGSLRDRLAGHPAHDLDLAVTGGDPATAADSLASAFGGRAVPIGRAPKVTWRVVGPATSLDVWGITDPRADILRRDFTVNALFWRLPNGPLIDLVGGLEDLRAGRMRVVADVNLADDPLRVLRAVRLVATRPGLWPTAATERALATHAGGLARIAHERIVSELLLLLSGERADRALQMAWRLGIMAALVPGWDCPQPPDSLVATARALTGLLHHPSRHLGAGARDVAPALLAAPAAGFPSTWNETFATRALMHAGFPARQAATAARVAGDGERLGRAMITGPLAAVRGLLAAMAEPDAALAWATARSAAQGLKTMADAPAMMRWLRRFSRRRPMLDGDEIAALLDLPPGPARAEAAASLRQAMARGEVRGRRQAERFLLAVIPG